MDNTLYTKFSDAQIGDTFTRPVLIVSITENIARNGKTFLRISLKDGSTEIQAMLFDSSIAGLEAIGLKTESVADVELNVSEYQGGKSFKISSIKPTSDSTLTINDFVKLPPIDLDIMYNEIIDMINRTADTFDGKFDPLSELAVKILEANKEHYMSSSAAITMHHNLKGGLLYHSYRMVKAADSLCNVYDTLDRELLVCGAALHDIGKIWEYKTSPSGDAEYAKGGVLFGHLYMGASLIKDYTKDSKYNMEKVQMLIHLILSHHGTQEFGAVSCPAIPEAFALNHIDDLDAKIYMCESHYETLKAGEFTEKKPFGLDNRIYKPNYK